MLEQPVQPQPKPRNVYIDDSLWAWARRRAQSLDTTISAVVREALEGLRAKEGPRA